ncbi:hypothetical protein ACIPSA_49845 [Streptomyces sp. NPDC086549]|uniref:hypothetical protein n=1 Tax=Streptomyces sp. NPDC086549 TaxID=3365752 RepID=UPI00380CA648
MTALRLWRIRLRALGSARLRIAVLFAAIAATTLTLLTALPARADPSPSPTATSNPAPGGTTTPTQQETEEIQKFLEEQNEKLSKSAQAALMEAKADDLRKQLPDEGGILGVFNVTDVNNLPISVYTVKSDTGNFMRWDLGMMNFLTEGFYMGTKWAVAFVCWLMAWALSFGLAKLLLSPALSIANSLHSRVIMEMGLPSLFLALCGLICTARIFFGDRAKGWGDAAVSLVLAALTTTLLSSTPQTLLGDNDGAIAVTRGFALEVADVILDADPTTPWATNDVTTPATAYTLTRPLTDALTDAFVVKPAMLLQYGQTFEGKCATEYGEKRIEQLVYDRQLDTIAKQATRINGLVDFTPDDMLTSGLTWQDTFAFKWVMNHYGGVPMEDFEKDCVKGDINAAKKASLDKLGGSFFLLIAALIVTVLIIGLVGSFLTAQCRLAWDAIRGEPALIAGTIPGAGRAFLWDWTASVWRSLAQMLIAVTSLAVFIIIIKAVLDPVQTDWGRELTLRFLGVDVVCIAAVRKRRQLHARTHQIANNLKARLSASRIGGTNGSIFTPAATPAPRQPRLGRSLVRGTLATAALATGNPMTALAYALPPSIGAAALIHRISRNRRHPARPHPARPAGQPAPNQPPAPPPPPAGAPATGPAAPAPGVPPAPPRPPATAPPQPSSPPRPTRPPRPTPPPRPSHRPGSRSARPAGARPGNNNLHRHRPRPQPPTPPARSARQQQLRRRLDRGIRRRPPTPRRNLQPDRSSREEYESYLSEQGEAELQRRAEAGGDADDA